MFLVYMEIVIRDIHTVFLKQEYSFQNSIIQDTDASSKLITLSWKLSNAEDKKYPGLLHEQRTKFSQISYGRHGNVMMIK